MLRHRPWVALFAVASLGVGCSRSVELADGDGVGGAGSGVSGNGGAVVSGQVSGNAVGSGPSSSGSGASVGSGSSGSGVSVGSGSGVTVGSVGSSGSGVSSSSGGMVCPAGTNCTQCIATSCADVWCDCTNNAECFALFDCVGGCNTDACVQTCYTAHSGGLSIAALVADCAATSCDGVCNWGGDPLDPCSKCLYTSCDDEMNACIGNPDCIAVWECLQGCGPGQLSCHQACYDANPAGVLPLEQLLQCSYDACPNTCN